MTNDGHKTFYTIGWSNEHIAELLTEVNERLIDLELRVGKVDRGVMAEERQRIKDKYNSKEGEQI